LFTLLYLFVLTSCEIALATEGLFRISASFVELEDLKKQFKLGIGKIFVPNIFCCVLCCVVLCCVELCCKNNYLRFRRNGGLDKI